MIDALPRWQQRGIALGILGVVILIIAIGIIGPLINQWRSELRWETRTLHEIGTARGLLAQRGELERLQASLAQTPLDQRVLAGTAGTATAQLQANLRGFLDLTAGALQNVQTLAPRLEGRFQRVTIQVSMTATIDQLTAFLERMSRAPGVYTTDNVQVTAPQNQDRTVNTPLNIRFDLSGYVIAGAGAP